MTGQEVPDLARKLMETLSRVNLEKLNHWMGRDKI